MKKRFFTRGLVLLLALCMVLPLAGCGKSKKEPEKTKMTDEEKDSIYEYASIELKNVDTSNMGTIRFSKNFMYTSMGNYNEATGEYKEEFIKWDLAGNEIARFNIPSGWDQETGTSYSINQFCLDNSGNVYGVDYMSKNYEVPETGEWAWEESYTLVRLDNSGNKVWSVPLGKYSSLDEKNSDGEYEYYYVERVLADSNGNLWVFDTQDWTMYDGDGKKIKAVKPIENISDVYPTKDGNFMVGSWGSDWDKLEFHKLNIDTGTVEEKAYELPGNVNYYSYSYFSGVGTQYEMYAANTMGVYAFNWGDTTMVKIMDYLLSDFAGTNIYNVTPISDTEFMGSYYDEEWNMEVAKFTKVPKDEVVDKYIIDMFCCYLSYEIRNQVVEFNRSHDDVRISVQDYSLYNTEDNDYQGGVDKLNEDILAGNVPDILIVPSDMNLGNYINKGLFTDLYALMDQDESINREDYLQNIIALGEYDGKLYELIPSFVVSTLVGKTSDVGEGFSWTYDDVNALLASKGDDVKLLPVDLTRNNVMNYGINLAFGQFYDKNTGECKFDSPDFIKFMELLKSYPEEISTDMWAEPDFWENYETQWRNGETILRYNNMYGFRNYIELSQGYFGEDVSYIGFPTAEGKVGSSAMVDYTFAISEKSAFKEEAWDFISYFIKDEFQDNVGYGFPVKLSSLEKKAETERQPDSWINTYYDEETGEEVEEEIVEDYYFYLGNEEMILTLPTEEECDYVMDFLKSITYRQSEVTEITAILEEEMAAYFAGQKDAQTVAGIIQGRVKIYVSEKQ